MISNPSESYFIYTGFCHSIWNSNIALKLLFLKNIKREAAKFNRDFTVYCSKGDEFSPVLDSTGYNLK